MRPDTGIQKADPAARRRLLRQLVPFAGLGVLLAVALSALREQLVDHAPLQLIYALLALLLFVSVAMLWPLRALWRTGRAAITARRFPPPGEPVVRDTSISTGEDAVLRGRLLLAFAVALGFFLLMTPLVIGWLLYLTLTWGAG